MEKKENIPPQTSQQGAAAETIEGRVNSALGLDNKQSNESIAAPMAKVWTYGKKSDMYYKHRALIKSGFPPEDLGHIANGRRKGCQCAVCKEARGEFEKLENKNQSDAVPSSHTDSPPVAADVPSAQKPIIAAPDVDDFLVELMDEDFAGVILDTPREAFSVYYRGRGLGKEVERVWEKDAHEVELLGKAGKAVWDKYAKLPNFKYKEIMVLGFVMTRAVGLRVWATAKIMKEQKQP